MGNIKV